MAVGTAVKSTQKLRLIMNQEATLGGAGFNSGANVYELPLLSHPSIVDLTAPLESAPQILGKYNMDSDHSAHNRTNQMFEISFSVLCSPTVLDFLCLFMFEDGDGTNTITGEYSPPDWLDGIDTDYSAVICIGSGGYSNTVGEERDVFYRGCVMKSLEITHAIDSESGKPVANCVFISGYKPTYFEGISTGTYNSGSAESGWDKLTGESATDFIDWADNITYVDSGGDGYEIHPYSYSVSMARDIQRVGCVDYTDFEPDGYVMQGGWDISMNVVYKRDENFASFLSKLYDSTSTMIRIGDSGASPFDIHCYGKISEHSVDTGSPELRNSITIKGMRNIENNATLLNLEM